MAREPYGRDIYDQGQQRPTGPGTDPTIRVGGAVDVSNLAGLVEVPQLDARGPAAYGAGLAALGEGVGQVGGNLMKLAQMQAEAINTKRVAESEAEMADISAEIELAHTNERDETKWESLTQDIISKRLSPLREDLSPDARDHIDSRRTAWQQSTLNNTKLRSAKKSIQDADSDLKEGEELSVMQMRLDDANNFVDLQVKNGAISEIAGEARKEQNKIRVEQRNKQVAAQAKTEALNVAKNSVITAVQQFGYKKTEEIVNEANFGDGKLDAADREHLKDTARAVERDGVASIQEDFNNRMASGELWTEAQIDSEWGQSPHMSPALYEAMAQDIRMHSSSEAKARSREIKESPDGVGNFYRLYAEADSWKPDMKTEEGRAAAAVRYQELKSQVRETVRGELQVGVNRVIDKKFGSVSSKQAKTETSEVIRQRIARAYDLDMKAANAYVSELVGDDPQSPNVDIADPRYQAAQRRLDNIVADQTRLDNGMREYQEANPNATEADLLKQFNKLVPEGRKIRSLEDGLGVRGDTGAAGVEASSVKTFTEAPDLPAKLPAPLQPYAQTFIDAGREYGLNPKFLAAISMLETDSGRSPAFRDKNNAMGISNKTGPTYQKSVEDSIFKMARGLAKSDGYYAKAKTIDEIGAIYAPPGAGNDVHGTNATWAAGVKAHLKRL